MQIPINNLASALEGVGLGIDLLNTPPADGQASDGQPAGDFHFADMLAGSAVEAEDQAPTGSVSPDFAAEAAPTDPLADSTNLVPILAKNLPSEPKPAAVANILAEDVLESPLDLVADTPESPLRPNPLIQAGQEPALAVQQQAIDGLSLSVAKQTFGVSRESVATEIQNSPVTPTVVEPLVLPTTARPEVSDLAPLKDQVEKPEIEAREPVATTRSHEVAAKTPGENLKALPVTDATASPITNGKEASTAIDPATLDRQETKQNTAKPFVSTQSTVNASANAKALRVTPATASEETVSSFAADRSSFNSLNAPAPENLETTGQESPTQIIQSPEPSLQVGTLTNLKLAQPPEAAATHEFSSAQIKIEELIDQVKLHSRPGVSRISFKIDPSELGRLTIKLSLKGGRLVGDILAGNKQIEKLLASGIDQLKSTLTDSGITVEALNIRSEADGENQTRAFREAADGSREGSAGRNRRQASQRQEDQQTAEQLRYTKELSAESQDGGINLMA